MNKPYTQLRISKNSDLDALKDQIINNNFEVSIRKLDKPLVLYGAGNLGKMAKEFFDYFEIPINFVVDKNPQNYTNDDFWKNTKVVGLNDQVDKEKYTVIICIVNYPQIEIISSLFNLGWKDIRIFYDITENFKDKYPLTNGWIKTSFDSKDKINVNKVWNVLNEDSKKHYLQFIAWRKSRIELVFENLEINPNNRFFIHEIVSRLKKDDVFVDCGAHHGNVTKKFVDLVNNKYKKIFAIEPDKNNLLILKSNVKNIEILDFALGAEEKDVGFYHGFGYASKINISGNNIVKQTTIDNLNLEPTFIKLHLEGGELNALKGAIKTIKKYRPIIAVTVYHTEDGLWQIPLFLIENFDDYNYIFRLHSWAGTGAVFYAIPKERKLREEI